MRRAINGAKPLGGTGRPEGRSVHMQVSDKPGKAESSHTPQRAQLPIPFESEALGYISGWWELPWRLFDTSKWQRCEGNGGAHKNHL